MTTTEDTAQSTFEAEWDVWHRERERYFGDPLGWVSLTGLHWLTDERERVADLPGTWRADADAVYVEGVEGIVIGCGIYRNEQAGGPQARAEVLLIGAT